MANLPNQDGMFAFFFRRLLAIPQFAAPTSPTTVLLIGANSGIGLAAAEILLSLPGLKNLLLTTRSREKSLQTRQHLANLCPASVNIETFEVDLTDYDSIREFVTNLNAGSNSGTRSVNIAILNAGLMMGKYELGHGRFELTLQVNYISTALLSLLLLPNLRSGSGTSSSPSRLSICSSDGHYFATPIPTLYNSDDGILCYLNDPSNFSSQGAYLTSKLLGILFGRALSEKLDPTEVLVNMINPGIARTNLFRDLGWLFRISMWLCGRSVHVAAGVVVQGALGDSGVVSGGFYSEGRDTKPLSEVFTERGRELQERLWSETLDLLRAEYEGSTSALAQIYNDGLGGRGRMVEASGTVRAKDDL
ncbi:NAD(P)-binding protein [Tuber magnatum]|uniref:NAD(P)-binding protein n=1 Tax=Tuber magnatum TaxID=42249 RepID=A0A317SH96_9PEZI|nr:NAD(P)-binding protein [Tuber magnatum]